MQKLTKTCRECGETKILNDFPIHETTTDGHRTNCRECYNTRQRDYQRKLRARRRAQEMQNG